MRRRLALNQNDVDVHGACLLFDRRHIRCHALDGAREGLLGQGIKTDAHGLTGADLGRVNLVHGRAHIQASVVDQVDGWRRRHTGWRWRGVFTDFTYDLGHRAGKRRIQHGAALLDARGADLGQGLRNIGLGGVAAGAPGLGVCAGLLVARARDKALFEQRGLAIGLALGIARHGASLGRMFARGLDLRQSQRTLRLLVVIPQLDQQLALFDAVAFLHGQHFNAPTHGGRQLGAHAGFHTAGAGVGDTRFNASLTNFRQDHGDGFGTLGPPDTTTQQADDQQGKHKATNQGGGHAAVLWTWLCAHSRSARAFAM